MSILIDAPIVARIMRIRYGNNIGVALRVKIDDVCMLLTAAHLVEGLQPGDAIAIRCKENWLLEEIGGYAPSFSGADVCALRPKRNWQDGLTEDRLNGNLFLGEDVVYCGFPLGMELNNLESMNGYPAPLVKRAIFSGTNHRGQVFELLFDTVNNKGFSGGPIIKKDELGKLQVAAIVTGYKFDSESHLYQRTPDGEVEKLTDYFVRPNSGFMTAISIEDAVKAARSLI